MTDPWKNFETVRRERKEDGVIARLLSWMIPIVICAVAMGCFFALYYVIPASGYRSRPVTADIAIEDTMPRMKRRFLIGAGIGALMGAGWAFMVNRQRKEKWE